MSGNRRISIAGRALWLITPLISLAVLAGVFFVFDSFKSSAQKLYQSQIELYVTERVARERELFQRAESHLEIIQDRFIRRFNSLHQDDYSQRFNALLQQESDGTWRNGGRFDDLNEYSGNFIDDDTEVTPALKKKMVIFSDLTNQYGAAWHNQFPNLFIIGQENYMSVYWPEVHWARFADNSIDLTGQQNYYHDPDASLDESVRIPLPYDEKQSVWTNVYYDNVSRKWLVSNIAPLFLNQQQVGTVGHDVYLNELFQRTLNESYPGAFNFIFTRKGRVIAHPDLMEQLFLTEGELDILDAGQPLMTEAFQRIQSGGLWQVYESSVQDYFLVLSHLSEPDWFFVAAYPKAVIEELAVQEARIVLITGAVLLVLTLIVVYCVMRFQVGQPLRQFIYAAHSVAQGDRNIWLDDTRYDELGELAASFLEMQRSIRQHTSQLTCEIYQKNQTQQKLEKAHHSLQEVNNQLELRVLQRTASLELANEELSDTLERLKETQDQLVEAEKMSSLGGLVAGVAHEINTPVGICLTAASSLQDDLKALRKRYQNKEMSEQDFNDFLEAAEEGLAMLISNNRRASTLIQSFKQVAVDQSSDERRHFVLRSYIDEILFSLQPRLKSTGHHITVQCPESIEMASCPGSLSQVLTNLIMNSVIHGFEDKAHGQIQISVTQDDSHLALVYQDDGCGMDDSAVQKVFDPFYTTKRGAGGSGLGAHLVYNLVTQKLKGSIRCTSAPGQGVCFTMILPLAI